jgi:hypothetical protein
MKVRKDWLTALTERRPQNKVFLKGWLDREKRFSKEFLEPHTPEKKNSLAFLALLLGGFLFFRKN